MRHAFSSGLYLDVNYTWGKELDFTTTGIEDGQGVNYGGTQGTPDLLNNSLNRNYGAADMPHRVVATLTYASPFGANGPFALGNKLGRAVLGDWTVGSVIAVQSGIPFVISIATADPSRPAWIEFQASRCRFHKPSSIGTTEARP